MRVSPTTGKPAALACRFPGGRSPGSLQAHDGSADDPPMAAFWIWCVRNPACLLLAVVIAAGVSGVADWSVAMPAAFVLTVVADSADHLARHARARQERYTAAILAIRSREEAEISPYQDIAA